MRRRNRALSLTIICNNDNDPRVFAEWLADAVQIQTWLRSIRKEELKVAQSLDKLMSGRKLDFSESALEVMCNVVSKSNMVVNLGSSDAEPILMMRALGFYEIFGTCLKLSKPRKISKSMVRRIILRSKASALKTWRIRHPEKIIQL